MSFESRRLRVQLPCPEGESVKELADVQCPFQTRCRGASFFCDPDTCVFGPQSRIGPGGLCHQFGTCDLPTRWVCPTRSVWDPPQQILVDPEQLPALKERLMAQLKEIERAEEELRRRGSGDQ
jgi:hypothetical protein